MSKVNLSSMSEAVALLSKIYLLISLSTETPKANEIFSIVFIEGGVNPFS